MALTYLYSSNRFDIIIAMETVALRDCFSPRDGEKVFIQASSVCLVKRVGMLR